MASAARIALLARVRAVFDRAAAFLALAGHAGAARKLRASVIDPATAFGCAMKSIDVVDVAARQTWGLESMARGTPTARAVEAVGLARSALYAASTAGELGVGAAHDWVTAVERRLDALAPALALRDDSRDDDESRDDAAIENPG